MPDIAVVDYGMGNLRSVAKALAHVAPNRTVTVSDDPTVIRAAAPSLWEINHPCHLVFDP